MFDMQAEVKIDSEELFADSIKQLKKINMQIAKLTLEKELLTAALIKAFDHDHEGQKTYEYGAWKVEVKTPYIYSLDKKKYESLPFKLPKEYNPIKESISYSLDKRLVDEYMQSAPQDVRDTLIELIEKKPGKASVTIKERA